jgi:hypothetical protein
MKVFADLALLLKIVFFAVIVGVVLGLILASNVGGDLPSRKSDPVKTGEITSTGVIDTRF